MYGFTGVSPTCPPGLPSVMKWLNLCMRREQCMLLPLSSASLSALFPSLCWYQGSGCCGLGKALTGLGGSGGPQCVPGWPPGRVWWQGKGCRVSPGILNVLPVTWRSQLSALLTCLQVLPCWGERAGELGHGAAGGTGEWEPTEFYKDKGKDLFKIRSFL